MIGPSQRPALAVAVLVAMDQGSKAFVREQLPLGAGWDIFGRWVRVIHAENPGAAFGFLARSELRGLFFSLATLVAFVVIVAAWRRAGTAEPQLARSMLFLCSGAIGNFLDRLMYRQVCDWIDVGGPGILGDLVRALFGSPRWPTFNLADVWVGVGASFLLLHVRFELLPASRSQPLR